MAEAEAKKPREVEKDGKLWIAYNDAVKAYNLDKLKIHDYFYSHKNEDIRKIGNSLYFLKKTVEANKNEWTKTDKDEVLNGYEYFKNMHEKGKSINKPNKDK